MDPGGTWGHHMDSGGSLSRGNFEKFSLAHKLCDTVV